MILLIGKGKWRDGFTRSDLLGCIAVIALLGAIAFAALSKSRNQARLTLCVSNLGQVSRAVLAFAADHTGGLPGATPTPAGPSWWWYKSEIRKYTGLSGESSPQDRIFACPMDRGYSDPGPFWKNPRFNFTSYVFNGVTLPGMPNIAGWKLASIVKPERTLLVMEWAAHAPLSWHRSRTGKANAPFYNNAECVTGFADGHAGLTKIYFDGFNAAYTRDPIMGYNYKFSGK